MSFVDDRSFVHDDGKWANLLQALAMECSVRRCTALRGSGPHWLALPSGSGSVSRLDDPVHGTISAAELRAAIAEAQARKAALAASLRQAEADISALVRSLSDLEEPRLPSEGVPTTPAAKIALFRRLFRGRSEVWPRLWLNAKTGKKGYAPVCGNDWRLGVCGKPKVKCGACPNQAFLPVTDAVLQDHLQGRHVAGVYAMLPDETCWFVAADFDEAQWQDDVLAFARVGRSKGIDVAVERSRSGNGAHAWIFFQEPVPAAMARKLGSLIITAACAAHRRCRCSPTIACFQARTRCPRVDSAT